MPIDAVWKRKDRSTTHSDGIITAVELVSDHLATVGGRTLKLGLATFVALVAALSLAFTAAPCAPAMAMEIGQPSAEAMTMANDMAARPCDHGQMQTEESSPEVKCRPGMACYAAVGQLPVQPAASQPIAYDLAQVGQTSDQPLRSRPPDQALRPPKSL